MPSTSRQEAFSSTRVSTERSGSLLSASSAIPPPPAIALPPLLVVGTSTAAHGRTRMRVDERIGAWDELSSRAYSCPGFGRA